MAAEEYLDEQCVDSCSWSSRKRGASASVVGAQSGMGDHCLKVLRAFCLKEAATPKHTEGLAGMHLSVCANLWHLTVRPCGSQSGQRGNTHSNASISFCIFLQHTGFCSHGRLLRLLNLSACSSSCHPQMHLSGCWFAVLSNKVKRSLADHPCLISLSVDRKWFPGRARTSTRKG